MDQQNNGEWQQQSKKNTINLFKWTCLWVLSTALAAFGPKFLWDFNVALSIAGICLSIAIGIGMVLANKRYLQGLDELQKKIQAEAMGLALGVGLVFSTSYELLEDIKLITFEPEIPHVIIVMCVGYMVGMILGNKRYQ